jgi:tripartite motif-containing protein 71
VIGTSPWIAKASSTRGQRERPGLRLRRGLPKLKFGERGSGQGEFQRSGIAPDAESTSSSTSRSPRRSAFDRHGNFVRGWESTTWNRQLSLPEESPSTRRARPRGRRARHEIKLFDREGKFIDRFGGLGKRLGQIAFPSGIAVDAQGRIFVAEKGNDRVQVFEEIGDVTEGTDRP